VGGVGLRANNLNVWVSFETVVHICEWEMKSVPLQWVVLLQREWAFAVLEAVFCVSANFELAAPGSEVVVSVVQLLRRRGVLVNCVQVML
jgi:hypothetical protein